MTEFTFANVDQWFKLTEDKMELVFKQALNYMLADIEIVPGKMRGGTPEYGEIPRDFGRLAASLQSQVHGRSGQLYAGPDSYILAIEGAELGDSLSFTWGTSDVDYASQVHYGTKHMEGTFWIEVAASKETIADDASQTTTGLDALKLHHERLLLWRCRDSASEPS